MTREEAIKLFEKILTESKKGLEKHPEEGKRVYGMRKELSEIALSALTPPNDPLTMEQLREMDGPVWVVCKPIEDVNGNWCLCQRGYIVTPAGSIFDVKEIPHWVFYRRPPEGKV